MKGDALNPVNARMLRAGVGCFKFHVTSGGFLVMANLWRSLWTDDCGAIIATEFLFFVTIVVIGLITGFAAIRAAVVTELTALGNAILALNVGFSFGGLSGCCAETEGSQAIDIPAQLPGPVCTPPTVPVVIVPVLPCT
jgi:hypothetical protein